MDGSRPASPAATGFSAPAPTGFSVGGGLDQLSLDEQAATNSWRAPPPGRGGAPPAMLDVPLASSISEPLADDAASARRARSFSGSDRWSGSDGSWDRRLGNLAYLLCCSVPAVYRLEFTSHRHSVPVERLHMLVDALIPICATVMFAKYFTEVGEAQEEQEYELCNAAQDTRRGDDPCNKCGTSEFWLFTGTAIAAFVAGIVGVCALWQKAPVAAREVLLLATMVFLISGGFGLSCHINQKTQEASFCFVMLILSLLWGFRAVYRYFVRDSIAKHRQQDSQASSHDNEGNSAQQAHGQEQGQQHGHPQVQQDEGEVAAVEHQHDEESRSNADSIGTTSACIMLVCICIGGLSAVDLSLVDGIFKYTDASCETEEDGCQWMDIFKVWLTAPPRPAPSSSSVSHASGCVTRVLYLCVCARARTLIHPAGTYIPVVCLRALLLMRAWVRAADHVDRAIWQERQA